MTKELIKQAFDGNAWVYSDNSYGQAVAPAMFDQKVRDYQSKELVVAPLGEQIDFTKAGSSWTVTIDAAPTAAALTAETDAAAVSAITNSQITFTPVEYTKKYEGSYTEMEDGFLPFMENASRKIGYAMAQAKDNKAVTILQAGATTTVRVNAKSADSALASTDVFDTSSIVKARTAIRKLLYRPYALVISPTQEGSLLGQTNIYKAQEYGTRMAIENGLLGNIYGFDIYVSDSIGASSSVEKAIALGKTGSGEKAFAIAQARLPMLETDKDISYRKVEVVGSERYDAKVLHAGAICLIASHQGA